MTGWADVRARVDAACRRAGRAPDGVGLVAVSKGVAAERIRAAVAEGARDLGENYVQEWQAKRDALADLPIAWHFIGRIQRNKAAAVAGCALAHSVADERVARTLDAAAAERGMRLRILLQVNLAGEASKAGLAPAELPRVLAALRTLPRLRVEGLMAIPPPLAPEEARPLFAALRELRDRQEDAPSLPHLSMGMSGDFEVAIEEGATLVRVGTAIFGPRQQKRDKEDA
jgi:pyridoxal phosphate enzyme (YggS family)